MKTVLLKDAVQMLIDLEVMFKNVPVEVKIRSVQIEIEMPEPVLQGIDLPMLKDIYTLREAVIVLGKNYEEIRYMIRTGKIKAVKAAAGKRSRIRGITLQGLFPHMAPEVKLYYQRQIDYTKYDITRYPALIATQSRQPIVKKEDAVKSNSTRKPEVQKSISKMLSEAKTLPAVKAVLTHVEILNTQGKLSPRSKVSELVQQLEDIIRCYGAIGNQQLKLWIKEGAMLANKVDVENERER